MEYMNGSEWVACLQMLFFISIMKKRRKEFEKEEEKGADREWESYPRVW
jgi:hypothetical protein